MVPAVTILIISQAGDDAVLPPDHQLTGVVCVTPQQASERLRELRARAVPVVAVLDGDTVSVPAFATEFAVSYRDVALIVAASTISTRQVHAGRGVWRTARSAQLVSTIRAAAQSAIQQARVRTTLGRLNIRIGSSEPVDDTQHHRLLLSSLYLSNILEQAKDAIFVTDRKGIVAIWNRAAESLFGRAADAIVNQRIDTVGGAAGETLLTLVDMLSPQRPHVVGELTTGEGEGRDVEVSLSLITDHEGTGIAVSAIARDVTERNALSERLRQQAEALEASNRHKEEFLAVLSHELRTPLNTVLGWTRMLQQMPHDVDHVRRAADMIARNATVQWRLVTDLLEYARITAGKFSLHVLPADLAALTRSTIDSVRPEIEQAGVSLVEEYADDVIVSVDRDRLNQVVLNLLTNAKKFTPEGGRIVVSVRARGEAAELVVQDTGRGIEPDFLPHVFEAFRQGDASTTRPDQGLGLGLAITKRIVESHGGTLSVHSEGAGHGATFTVMLDRHPAGSVDATAVVE